MIVLEDVRKSFKNNRIIDFLSLHVKEGEAIGLVGLNGAGKTTIINMMAGAIMPDSGYIRVGALNPFKEKYKNLRQIGYINGDKTQLWTDLALKDSFEHSKYMYKIDQKNYIERMAFLCNILELNELLNIPVNKLSLGQRVRADFAYSVLHNPKVLYLDEPTIGVDLMTKEKIINLINELKSKQGTAIVFANHNLLEIEKTCEKIILIHKGKKLYEGEIGRLKKDFSCGHLLKLKLDDVKVPDFHDLPVYKYKVQQDNIWIYYDINVISSSSILNHVIKQCRIRDIKMSAPTIEDVIREIYNKE
ncbi:ATP-binding cassette domain-containing protein [Clostridium sp.]|uniref:ATP-binding cassette domain-containing protein n=1 Tax=Clostridium sp. TaxID=1506 RepID=UPI0026133125|nr:ATP-binding cassette domain-containing protein [Clostridium sp.]